MANNKKKNSKTKTTTNKSNNSTKKNMPQNKNNTKKTTKTNTSSSKTPKSTNIRDKKIETSFKNDIQNKKIEKLNKMNKQEENKKDILKKINPEELKNKKAQLLNHLEQNSIQDKKIEKLNKINKSEKKKEEKKPVLHREQYKKINDDQYNDLEEQDVENLQDLLEEKIAEQDEQEENDKDLEDYDLNTIVEGVQKQLKSEKIEQEKYLEKIKELTKEEPKQKKTRKKLRLKANVKFVIAILVFIASLVVVEVGFVNRRLIPHQPKIDVEEPTPSNNEEPQKDPKLEEIQNLYEQNNDLIGWLTIEGTKIDYPVMFTKGEDFYLRKDFYKKKSTAGTLYIDKHQTMEPKDINIIIHGHNMHDGTMFADLIKYKKESYYEEHKKLVYYTLEERQEYEIIAVFLSKVYNVGDKVFKYYKFYGEQDETSYNDFIQNIKKLSLYDIETTATYPEELITLSTCEYSQEDGRLAVVAKRVS